MIYMAEEIQKHSCQTEIDGKWYPARPIPCSSPIDRLRWAWGVFTGRYDVLCWRDGNEKA